MNIPTVAPSSVDAFRLFGLAVDPENPDRSRAIQREIARGPAPDGRYRHWDTLRRIPPPEHLTVEDVWAARKFARQVVHRTLPLVDTEGQPFRYSLVDPVLMRLHRIDREAAGQIVLPEQTATPGERDRYVTRSLIEEAITSSQLEGAATTRAVAKDMLRSGRPPRDLSEQMVVNNYRAMAYVRDRVGEPLTPGLIEGIQRAVTHDTPEAARGPYRSPGDGVAIYDDQNQLLHTPPPADQAAERMERLCTFANEAETGVFLHPVLKSVLLHFWLAYDHPFVDGNGRAARALFYWSMLREGFWLAEFLSLSSVLNRAPAKYAESFLYTETDENDVTYFLLAQLRAVELAIGELRKHLAKRAGEFRELDVMLGPESEFNHRQRSILTHALRHPAATYNIASEQARHGVAYATARGDLLALAERGLLRQRRSGKKYVFAVPPDLDRLIASGPRSGGER